MNRQGELQTLPLPMVVEEQLLKGEFAVPLLPAVVNRVLNITQQESYALREISEIIVTDSTITAQLLKQANSAFYHRGQPIETVAQAIQYLGAQAVTNLVLTLSLQSIIAGRDRFLADRQRLWQHSLACALLSRSLAAHLSLDREQAYLCGLMIGFGKILLFSQLAKLMQEKPDYQTTPQPVIKALLATYYPKVGALVAAKWKLPPSVQETLTHHQALSFTSGQTAYAAVASLCDALLSERGEDTEAEESNGSERSTHTAWLNHPAAQMLGLQAALAATLFALIPECQSYALQMAGDVKG